MTCRLGSLLFLTVFAVARADSLPQDFVDALKSFRAEGTKGWAFTQSTATIKESLVERFDPSKLEGVQWTLLSKNGHSPSEKELKDYVEKQSRRSNNDSAPDVTKQLDFARAEHLPDNGEQSVYRFALLPAGKDDTSAQYMLATFIFHRPTHTIERVELQSREPFAPMFSVKIQEAHTTIEYTLPTPERPTLLDRITLHVRGRALWVKSLDEDMTVLYSDFSDKRGPSSKNASQKL